MFIDRFSFNSHVTQNGDGSTVSIPFDKNVQGKKYPNFIFKKQISFKFEIEKMFGIVKKYIGLGDIVEFITKYTGIKYLIVKITKGNCGCEKRRKKFNEWLKIPYFSFYYQDTNTVDIDNINNNVKIVYRPQIDPMSDQAQKELNAKRKPCGCGAKMTVPVEKK